MDSAMILEIPTLNFQNARITTYPKQLENELGKGIKKLSKENNSSRFPTQNNHIKEKPWEWLEIFPVPNGMWKSAVGQSSEF